MARPVRIEYAGAVCRVMARGNQGRPLFADDLDRAAWLNTLGQACGNQGRAIYRDDRDRLRFLETLGEACGKTGWRLHAYVLM
jgi:hypothetical protein